MKKEESIHVEAVFKDMFSGATMVKNFHVDGITLDKVKRSIGKIVRRFENNIVWEWKLVKVNVLK